MNLYSFHSDPKSLHGFKNAGRVPKLAGYISLALNYQMSDVILKIIDCIHAIEYEGNLHELDAMPESLARGFNPRNIHDWEALKQSQNNNAIATFKRTDAALEKFLTIDNIRDVLPSYEDENNKQRNWIADAGSPARMEEFPDVVAFLLENKVSPYTLDALRDSVTIASSRHGWNVELQPASW